MYSFTISGIRCTCSLLFPAVLLYLLIMDPSGIVLLSFLAAMMHETGHIAATILLKHHPKEIRLSCFGMRLIHAQDSCTSRLDDVLIALAGPACNLAVYAAFHMFRIGSLFADIHLMLAVLNLLPILPLDGGVMLEMCLPDSRINRWIKNSICVFVIGILLLLGVYLTVIPPHNVTLLIVDVYLIFVRLFYNGN